MGLNIKNERVCALARDVAQRTGQTQTGAIESALEAYLRDLLAQDEALREQRRAEQARRNRRADAIIAAFHAAPQSARTVDEIMGDLYDPITGAPR